MNPDNGLQSFYMWGAVDNSNPGMSGVWNFPFMHIRWKRLFLHLNKKYSDINVFYSNRDNIIYQE